MTPLQQDHFDSVCRHMARLMHNIETANCPEVYKDAVRKEMYWLRSDVLEIDRQHGV